MEIVGKFATEPKTLSVFVDAWNVQSAIETMFEMGALTVLSKKED